jgi:hypothetical protein
VSGRRWTTHERDFLMTNYAKLGSARCAKKLGRSIEAIKAAAHNYGAPLAVHMWTEKDFAYMRTHWPTKGSKFCAPHIGTTIRSVQRRAQMLGLKFTGPDRSDMKRCRTCSTWRPAFMFLEGAGRCTQCDKRQETKPPSMKGWRREIESL